MKMNSRPDPKSLQQLLKDHSLGAWQKIFRQAQRLLVVDNILAPWLPEEVAVHCRTMKITATSLTLGVDSAVWSTRLHYLKSELLTKLQRHPQLATVQQLLIRIYPPVRLAENPFPPPRHQLSENTKQLIKETATAMTDSPLKYSLLKLSEA